MSVYDEVAVYDIPFSELEARVLSWATEALELRHGVAEDPDGVLGVPEDNADAQEVMHFLRRVRVRSDRVDFLLSRTTQAKARAKRAQEHAQFQADLAFDTAAQQNGANRRQEFVTAMERKADANLDSLEQRRMAHHAARLVSITTEVHEVVNQVHWQLDAIRKDLRSTLHALQFESGLER